MIAGCCGRAAPRQLRAAAIAGPTLTLALGKLEAWEGSIESSVWVTDSVESGSVSQSGGVSTQLDRATCCASVKLPLWKRDTKSSGLREGASQAGP